MIRILLIAAAALLLAAPVARALDLPDKAVDDEPAPNAPPAVQPAPPPAEDGLCGALSDAARDARIAWQARTLEDLNARVEARLKELEAKRAEYQQWLQQREAMLRGATDNLLAIYSRMKPESASAQLEVINEYTAAGVLMKLNPRVSSAILNEMSAERAAQLAMIMAGLTNRQRRLAEQQQPKPAPPGEIDSGAPAGEAAQ
jgi:flagellar motility protein MotE (MotC chaperone)